jgi:hypothetical protein
MFSENISTRNKAPETWISFFNDHNRLGFIFYLKKEAEPAPERFLSLKNKSKAGTRKFSKYVYHFNDTHSSRNFRQIKSIVHLKSTKGTPSV